MVNCLFVPQKRMIETGESMVFWAFRYCLGRRSYAVSDCVENLLDAFPKLRRRDQLTIQKEIREAIQKGEAGMDMDVKEWQRILELPINEETRS
jgi:hypothetical protein